MSCHARKLKLYRQFAVTNLPFSAVIHSVNGMGEDRMDAVFQFSFDAIVVSFLACCLIREGMIMFLPDEIAGPGGSFIDTGADTGRES